MKKTLLLVALFAGSLITQAQDNNLSKDITAVANTISQDALAINEPVDTAWKTGGVFGLTFGQTSFKNWAGGGINSVSVGGLFSHFRNYSKGDWTWDNNLDLAYGMLWQGDNDGVKTDDKIEVNSKVGRAFKGPWYAAGLLNFRSQFAEGFDDPFAAAEDRNVISRFMAPGYGLGSIGIDYKPSDNFTAYISPITAKFTFVTDQDLADLGAFGVDPAVFAEDGITMLTEGSNMRAEFGAYLRASYNTDIAENIGFLTKLDLFANYETIEYVDINWETLLSMKVNEYISTTFGTQVIYDHDIKIARDLDTDNPKFGPVAQLRQFLNVGFTYKF